MSCKVFRIILTIFLFANLHLQSQSVYEKTAGFTGAVTSLITCADSGFAYCGNSVSDSGNIILARYNPQGVRLWQKEIGSSDIERVHDFVQTTDGGFVAVGTHWASEYGMLAVKLNASGVIDWVRKISHGFYDRANSVCATPDGGIVIAGETETTAGGSSAMVVKLSASGSLLWVREFSGFKDGGYSIIRMFDGRYSMIGLTDAGAQDNIGIVCFDSTSVFWTYSMGSPMMDSTGYNHHLTQTPDSGLVFCGTTWTIPGNSADFFIAKLSKSGVPLFMRTYGTTAAEYATGITSVANGILVSGYVRSSSGPGVDPMVIKLQHNSLPLWGYSYPGADYNPMMGITALPGGDIIAGGSFGNGTVTDQGTIWRMSSAGNTCKLKMPSGTISFMSGWHLFPVSGNPSSVFVFPVAMNQFTTPGETIMCNCSGSLPVSATVPVSTFCSGDSTLLTFSAQPGYQYQLYRNNVPGATINSSGFTIMQGGNYFVVQQSGCATDTSNTLKIKVNPTPLVSVSTSGRTRICDGHSVTLFANSQLGVQYQWMNNGVNIPVAVFPSYGATQSGDYKVRVWYAATGCYKTSTSVQVTVLPAPPATITSGGPLSFCNGDSVVLLANNGTGYTYQWRKNGVPVSGANAINYAAKTAGTYKVRVRDVAGCTQLSSGVVVTVPCREEAVAPAVTRAYPNPASVGFSFVTDAIGPVEFQMTDHSGRVLRKGIWNQGDADVDVRDLASGIYLLHLSAGSERSIRRIAVLR